MPALSAYADFLQSLNRARRLHDFTNHVYAEFHETGIDQLRRRENREKKLQIQTASGPRSYPLKVLAYHARDVYPDLLRSVLLVRIVAAHELLLIESIKEISERTSSPFKTDAMIEIQQSQLLTLAEKDGLLGHIVAKAQRKLSSGGLNEMEKYYKKHFGISTAPTPGRLADVTEIHERRHLHVHANGVADEQYMNKHKGSSVSVGDKLPVDAKYFNRALFILNESALHVRKALLAQHPPVAAWQRVYGQYTPTGRNGRLFHIEFVPLPPRDCAHYCNMSAKISTTNTLADVAVWVATNGVRVRQVIGGSGGNDQQSHTNSP